MTIPAILRPLPLLMLLAGCAVGPDYVRPDASVPEQFREQTMAGKNWQSARPADDLARGSWWQAFGDAELDAHLARVDLGNQNIRLAEAQYRAALAQSASARAGLFPTVKADASGSRGQSGSTKTTTNSYAADLTASWELDLWGRVRRASEAAQASAQASAGDLESARLSARALFAQNYFALRIADQQLKLYTQTVAAYQKALELTRNRLASGVATRADVAQAETQLASAKAQVVELELSRTQLEHALAIQLGRAPADFTLAPTNALATPPAIPEVLPAELLQRRPDIAAAERRVAAANAEIGVAQAAWYPTLSLAASGGYHSSSFADWFSLPNRIWSLGPELAATLFDGGARSAAKAQAQANWEATVASYRQAVLSAFGEVEDDLAALRQLDQEERLQREALAGARESLAIVTNQYRAGTATYLSVVQSQVTALASERSVIELQGRRLAASVALIKASGGGWQQK
ncbi:efflux transporter outer membrane subunit [Niveibacterium terrae]|uniref:efflux transporter outer membrane subunit n=1 Tax=Niveibacterium terrae TaxID=3373598 RepID=UPI003A940439